jgi:hypothetical protein
MKMTKISRELLSSMTFRPFTQNDYYGFEGVESPVPLIAENEDEGICVIIDGDYAELYAFDGCANFDLIDQCDSIRELPIKTDKQIRIEAEIVKLQEAIGALKRELV